MGSDPKRSVVDPTGESWQVQGLYVADASVFPTASGVNPMVTIESLSHMIAEGAAKKLTGRDCEPPYSTSMKCQFDW